MASETPLHTSSARRPGPPAIVNRLMLAVLRSPLHRLVSGGVLMLTMTGRRSGAPVRLPVQYTADGERLVIVAAGAPRKRWWRNLIGGAPVTVCWRGRLLAGHGRVLEGAAAAAALAAWRRGHPRAVTGLETDLVVVTIDGLHSASPA